MEFACEVVKSFEPPTHATFPLSSSSIPPTRGSLIVDMMLTAAVGGFGSCGKIGCLGVYDVGAVFVLLGKALSIVRDQGELSSCESVCL